MTVGVTYLSYPSICHDLRQPVINAQDSADSPGSPGSFVSEFGLLRNLLLLGVSGWRSIYTGRIPYNTKTMTGSGHRSTHTGATLWRRYAGIDWLAIHGVGVANRQFCETNPQFRGSPNPPPFHQKLTSWKVEVEKEGVRARSSVTPYFLQRLHCGFVLLLNWTR